MTRSDRSGRMLAFPIAVLLAALLLTSCALLPPGSLRGGLLGRERDEDLGLVDVYAVEPDGSLSPEPGPRAEIMWDVFTRVVTPGTAGEVISQYRVGDAPEVDTLAYVHQDEEAPERWVLGANASIAEEEDLLLDTLVHEYAHLLSLSASELDVDDPSCPVLPLEDGCPRESSVLLAFHEEFWADYTSAPEPDNVDEAVGAELFGRHEDDFFSDYAAMNVVEDFAESCAAYVLEDVPDGDSVWERKLQFFDDHAEFAMLRERVRGEFSLA